MQGAAYMASGPIGLTSRVRVAYCIDSFDIGGTELNALRTLEALDRQRFELTVFHFHESGPLRARYEALGLDLIHVPIGPLYAPRTALQGMRFFRALRRKEIELVHTHDVYTNIFAAPWARLAGCRFLAARRWLDDVPRPGLVVLNRWSYRFAHRILVNSAMTARALTESEGVPPPRVVEMPNFLEERAFLRVTPEARESRLRGWGVPPGAYVVGSVARLAPVKNLSMLVRAVAQLPPQVHLVLIGDGPSRGELESLTRALRLERRVHFTGQLLEPINLHQFFDVSALCSRSEGFPNSVIEALAAGCPVIATPVGGVPEVITHRHTGLLVPLDEADTLAAGITELRRDARLVAQLREAGLAVVRLRYHESAVIGQLEALYAALARSAGKDALLT